MLKYLVCMLIVTAAVTAYDFTDSDFNEYLFEELRSDYDDAIDVLFRSRRDVEEAVSAEKKACSRRDFKKDFHCCNNDKIDVQHIESYKDAKKVCFMQIRGNNSEDSFDPFDCQKMQQVKEQMVCISECVSKKFNIIDESGELQRKAIYEQVRKTVGEIQWNKAELESIVDKCMTEVEKKNAAATKEETKGCNRCPLDMQHCLWREVLNGCPVDMRVDSSKCNKIRERLSKDDTSTLNKHFLNYFSRMRPE